MGLDTRCVVTSEVEPPITEDLSISKQALILNEVSSVPSSTLRRILELAKQGLPIVFVGTIPTTSSGLEPDDANIADLVEEILQQCGSAKVDSIEETPTALSAMGIQYVPASRSHHDPGTDLYTSLGPLFTARLPRIHSSRLVARTDQPDTTISTTLLNHLPMLSSHSTPLDIRLPRSGHYGMTVRQHRPRTFPTETDLPESLYHFPRKLRLSFGAYAPRFIHLPCSDLCRVVA
jgi:hypothetical protein